MDTKVKKIVALKPVQSANDNHYLQLTEDDFNSFVKDNNSINTLKVSWGVGSYVIDFSKSINSYMEKGALVLKGRISEWIKEENFIEKGCPILLFLLIINETTGEHYYRYFAELSDIKECIDKILK